MDVQFIMFREDGVRKSFRLPNESTIVGRQEDCDIRIPLPEVSRRHAEIKVDRHGVHINDLGSANGIFVNNKRIKKTDLSAGDFLVIGPVVFTVQIDGQPKDIKPVKTRVKARSAFGSEAGTAPVVKASSDEDTEMELDELDLVPDGSSLDFVMDDLDDSSSPETKSPPKKK
ncbi:MAG: hypothetical protein HJJLKODD_01451 [Phycisphaerae bacterium]|nr:hypothetical protein [Phycisphaerae bacterium]